jgi:hypothetical protein
VTCNLRPKRVGVNFPHYFDYFSNNQNLDFYWSKLSCQYFKIRGFHWLRSLINHQPTSSMFFELFKHQFPYGNERSWHSFFGVDVETCEGIWTRYFFGNKECKEFLPIHLLWSLSFLRLYDTWEVLHCMWNANQTTFERIVWGVIKYMYYYMNEIRSEDRFTEKYEFFGSFFARVVTDCTECEIERPQDKILQSNVYSGYKKTCTLKYLTVVCINSHLLIEADGPFYGKEDDLTVTFTSGVLEDYLGIEHLMGDQKYKGIAHCIKTIRDVPFLYQHKFAQFRQSVEHFNAYIKKYKCMSTPWRSSKIKHRWCFYLICHISNMEIRRKFIEDRR